MKILLISDPETDKSAAAMDVHIGRYGNFSVGTGTGTVVPYRRVGTYLYLTVPYQ